MMIESGVPLNKHNTCPICGNGGVAVKKIIVDHLVVDEFKKSVSEEGYRICMNEGCDIVYYNNNKGIRFTQDQVCVPIWFKKMLLQCMLVIVAKLPRSKLWML